MLCQDLVTFYPVLPQVDLSGDLSGDLSVDLTKTWLGMTDEEHHADSKFGHQQQFFYPGLNKSVVFFALPVGPP